MSKISKQFEFINCLHAVRDVQGLGGMPVAGVRIGSMGPAIANCGLGGESFALLVVALSKLYEPAVGLLEDGSDVFKEELEKRLEIVSGLLEQIAKHV